MKMTKYEMMVDIVRTLGMNSPRAITFCKLAEDPTVSAYTLYGLYNDYMDNIPAYWE